jgi:hypothetical protein
MPCSFSLHTIRGQCRLTACAAGFKAQKEWIESHPTEFNARYGTNPLPVDIFWMCYYQALAAAAVHPEAYVYTPKGVDWKKSSIWANVEFPSLTANENVKRIYRVDPRPNDEDACGAEEELVWDRGRGDAVGKLKWTCPIT